MTCSLNLPACVPLTLTRLGDEARRYGVSRLARELGVSRESIHRGFRDGANPRAKTVLQAAKILGLLPHFDVTGESSTVLRKEELR